ncbi:MAG: hypothetical protein ACKOC8_11420 [Pirellulales bacterium]
MPSRIAATAGRLAGVPVSPPTRPDAPHDRREQHTFAGHAWLIRDAESRDLGWVRGKAGRIEGTIDDSLPAARPPAAAAETPYGSMKRLSFLKRHLLDAAR